MEIIYLHENRLLSSIRTKILYDVSDMETIHEGERNRTIRRSTIAGKTGHHWIQATAVCRSVCMSICVGTYIRVVVCV